MEILSFVALMTRKRSLSFKRALHAKDGQMRVDGADDRAVWATPASAEQCCSASNGGGMLSAAPSDHCLAIDDATALTLPRKHCVLAFPILSVALVAFHFWLRDNAFWVQTLRFQAPTSLEESYEYVTYSVVPGRR